MPPEREAFEQQALDQLLLLITDVLRVGDELAPALKAAVIRVPSVRRREIFSSCLYSRFRYRNFFNGGKNGKNYPCRTARA
jgi:hypothetical protein